MLLGSPWNSRPDLRTSRQPIPSRSMTRWRNAATLRCRRSPRWIEEILAEWSGFKGKKPQPQHTTAIEAIETQHFWLTIVRDFPLKQFLARAGRYCEFGRPKLATVWMIWAALTDAEWSLKKRVYWRSGMQVIQGWLIRNSSQADFNHE